MNPNYPLWFRVEVARCLRTLILPTLSIVAPAVANGQQPESLHGLSDIQVAVYLHLFTAGGQESAEKQMQIQAEQLLRDADIPLLESPSPPNELVPAWFYISVRISRVGEHSALCLVETSLRQGVSLKRDPSIQVIAITWNKLSWELLDKGKELDSARSQIADHVNDFIRDYNEQNAGQVGYHH